MTNNLLRTICFVLVLTTSALPAKANSFRCNGKIISTGYTITEVKLACGKPFDTIYIGRVKIGNKYVNIDQHTYLPGKGKLTKILVFHDGKLAEILNGPRI